MPCHDVVGRSVRSVLQPTTLDEKRSVRPLLHDVATRDNYGNGKESILYNRFIYYVACADYRNKIALHTRLV